VGDNDGERLQALKRKRDMAVMKANKISVRNGRITGIATSFSDKSIARAITWRSLEDMRNTIHRNQPNEIGNYVDGADITISVNPNPFFLQSLTTVVNRAVQRSSTLALARFNARNTAGKVIAVITQMT